VADQFLMRESVLAVSAADGHVLWQQANGRSVVSSFNDIPKGRSAARRRRSRACGHRRRWNRRAPRSPCQSPPGFRCWRTSRRARAVAWPGIPRARDLRCRRSARAPCSASCSYGLQTVRNSTQFGASGHDPLPHLKTPRGSRKARITSAL
jgi:hypothetical protein